MELISRRWWWLAAVLLFAGCASFDASLHHPLPPAPLAPPPVGRGWWSIRFQMDRPDGQTQWPADLLIAHGIAGPLLTEFQADIHLWRFHRRSADDDSGHQFSFIFYSRAAVADRINRAVAGDPLVVRMRTTGVVREVHYAAVDQNDRPDPGDTSDPSWSPVMKDNWPYYIMGVSRMWLGMIDQISRQASLDSRPLAPLSVARQLAHYKQVDAQITQLWQQEGYHALLHHLNAIFGYGPLVYWEKRWKSF
jgi:hypothetical protein